MNRSLARLRASLRQWRHHPVFRIEAPSRPGAERALLERLLAALASAESQPDPAATTPSDRALADAATGLWRAQLKLGQDESDVSRDVRQANHHLRTSRDALTEAGLVIQDHNRTRFHPGLSLEVLTYIDDPTLSHEVVVETIRPSVYLHDRRIQMGQVIVGRPVPHRPQGSGHEEHRHA